MATEPNSFSKKQTLNCNGKLLDLSSPKIMGILNVTPDSFYDGGRFSGETEILNQADKMLSEGADIIDVGGMSSRPGAEAIPETEELNRVLPPVRALAKKFPQTIISIDTFRSNVAEAAVNEGAALVNDISAGNLDDKMMETVARLKTPYVLMHMQGTPLTMQRNPSYDDVIREVTDFFIEKLSLLKHAGIKDVVIDPGFGFGKSLEHNYQMLRNLSGLKIFGLPLMVGISRKSMICNLLKINPDKALNGTTALQSLALLNGADILRVHDVKEAKEVIRLLKFYGNPQPQAAFKA